MKLSLINVAVAVAIVARDRSSFADKPCCVMNGSSTIAPKTRRTEEFRPEQSFIVWILSRLDIKSDLLSSLLTNLLSSLLSILGSPWADWSGSVRVVSGLWSGFVRVVSESVRFGSVAMFTIVFSGSNSSRMSGVANPCCSQSA